MTQGLNLNDFIHYLYSVIILDIIEKEYSDFIDKETQGSLYLTKSDIFIKRNNKLSANRLLNIVINDSEYSNCLRAYAYRQLSWLTLNVVNLKH